MPPELEDQIGEMDDISTVAKDEADAPAKAEAEQSADAASSTAEDVSKPAAEDTLSVVRDVVDGREQAAVASSANAEVEGAQGADAGTAKEPKEPDNENYSDVPFNKHPRFQEVLGKLKAAEVDATRYRNVETFIEEQGLTGKEAAELLQIGGLIKTDPVKAWPIIQPIVQKVLIAAGEVLPDDLKTRVQNGEMSREAALEVSRTRALHQTAQARQQFDQQRLQSRQQVEARNSLLGAVHSWEAERRQRDPNFEAKMPAIEKEVTWLQAKEGKPNTPEGVKAQLEKAYKAVSATYTPPAASPRKAVRPITGGQVNGNVRPEIKSSLDAVNAVLARRTG